MHSWIKLFEEQLQQTTLLEWLAVILGVAEVLLARVNNVWLYPTGIAGTLIGIYLLLIAGLYAESALNVYYLVMSVYGWVFWLSKSGKQEVKISWSTKREWTITLLIVFVGWAILYVLLKEFTTSNVPFWDSFASATAWAGMWLLARRKIENWILLNISNVVAMPLLFYKKLPMLALLTLFLFVIAFWGYFEWASIYKKENREPEPALS
ncbi:nicotinamide riboside transporter PnuC [Mucilaginibacter sp. X4EP1]|jgi:nicotinamide mononucleotide transporter|uniref:nicotinamide riboside transporter PnuC n=1 Tax=Mucilaginibacter sp. X4EP1 TaxID=2723092 RepID=UPI0021683B27|nr:nicotinamide riboside transporter PnuC [Mucilaginibacter sp. X4EP1]MCS3811847.1 nicotinamide mononucleotide transporter [Mucilaginibacter sp. X4EP1]